MITTRHNTREYTPWIGWRTGHDNCRLGHNVCALRGTYFLGRLGLFLALGRCFHGVVVLPPLPVLELKLLGTKIWVASVAAACRRSFLWWLLLGASSRRFGLRGSRRWRCYLNNKINSTAPERAFTTRTCVLTLPALRLNLPPSVLWKLLLLSGGLLTVFAGSFLAFEADVVGVGFTGVGFTRGWGVLDFASSASTLALLKLKYLS